MSMKLVSKSVGKPLFFCAIILTTAFSPVLPACSGKQGSQEQDSNLGEEQSDMTVDTTAGGGFSGTDNSTGRADADTSGSGRQMSADTTKDK